MERRLFDFIWLPTFERMSKKLLDDEDRRAIEETLCANLEAGPLMPRTGGFRKLRYALEGRGKSGGARVVYLPDEKRGRVFMARVYAKGAKTTLTRREEHELRGIAEQLSRGGA